jgi:PAS domain S-box-containing protein
VAEQTGHGARQFQFDTRMVSVTLALAAVYFVAGKLALMQAVPPGYATIIFFPSGIALAAMVRFGVRLLPGVALGAILLNLSASGSSLPVALLVGGGTTVQAWLALRLFERWCTPALASTSDVLAFLFLAPLACLVNATVSVAGLAAMHVVNTDSMVSNWIFWWAGDTIGVLVAAPLAWLVIGTPAQLWRRRRLLLGVPLCLSSAAFILTFEKVSALENQQNQHQFILNAQQLADVFQFQFSEHERLLYAMGAIFNQSQVATPEAFARMARSYLDNRPELRLLSWAPRVAGPQRSTFERQAQEGIAADFVIRAFSPDKSKGPSAEHLQYFATAFIEPLAGNERVLGMDLLSEPLRAAMVRNATARKRPTASEPIDLVQSPGEHGILLSQVVFPSDDLQVGEPRGILVAVIEMRPYINLALAQTGINGLAVRLDDVTVSSHPLLIADQKHAASALGEVKKTLTMGGRNYLLTVAPTESYVREHQEWQSWGALGAGMAMTGLLGAFLLLISGQHEQVEALVTLRTSEVKEREGRLNAILDQAADAILTCSLNGKLMSANGAAERLFGYQNKRMAGLDFYALLPPGKGDAPPLTLEKLAARAGSGVDADPSADVQGMRSDGNTFPVAIGASLVELPDESFYVCLVHDLSEQRQAQQKILALEAFKQAQNDLRTAEKMASLGSLVAGIAHELNTPIGNSLLAATSLSGRVAEFQESLREGQVRKSALQEHFDDTAQACEMISGSLHRVADLITTFKQVAVDQTIDQRREFDLLAVCQATLVAQASSLHEAGCVVHCAIAPGMILRSYPGSVSQVITSLVNNALLHAFSGRSTCRIEVTAHSIEGDSVELIFRDNGVGMPPDILSRVFDPFFTTKLGQGSSGLGMNIVYNVVTGMLGGRISIESELGQGTSVIMIIPKNSVVQGESAPSLDKLTAAAKEAEAQYKSLLGASANQS